MYIHTYVSVFMRALFVIVLLFFGCYCMLATTKGTVSNAEPSHSIHFTQNFAVYLITVESCCYHA